MDFFNFMCIAAFICASPVCSVHRGQKSSGDAGT